MRTGHHPITAVGYCAVFGIMLAALAIGIHFIAPALVGWLLMSALVLLCAALLTAARHALAEDEQRFLSAFTASGTAVVLAGLDGRMTAVNDAFCVLLGRSARELIGTELGDIAYPRGGALPADRLVNPSPALSAGRVERLLMKPAGEAIWVELVWSLVRDRRQRPRYFFGQALDITARRATQHQLALRVAQHEAIANIGRAAREGADIAALSEQATSGAVKLLGLEFAAVLEQREGTSTCRVVSACGPHAKLIAPVIRVESWPLVQLTLGQGEPVTVADWKTQARLERTTIERDLEIESALAVPLRGRHDPFGVLIGEARQPREFSDGDVNFLRALANMLAETIEHRQAEADAAHATLHDPLTKLPNRILFADLLRHTLAQARRPGATLAVILIGIDHLRLVNDTLGHRVGDEVLQEAVARFASVLRASDTLARLTSDEFLVLCDDLHGERAAMRVADRLLTSLSAPLQLAGEELTISATAGVAIAAGGDGAESLLRDAEAAMHRAKEYSRGGYQLFDSQIHERNVGRLRSETALRRAIGTDELYLVYQPVVALESGLVDSVEALLRWQHPDWGPVSPIEFIPIAEESGMIIPIGRSVLTESVRQLATWLARGRAVQVSVNISARQLFDDALVELTARTLNEHDVPPSNLILELTETAVIADSDAALEVLCALKELGVRLALDDYGSGYTSLRYLSRFPFDIVKLDRALIRMLGASNKDDIVVASTIEMSHALDLLIVCEGVETLAQDSKLRELGCDFVQGYYYSKPVSAAELDALEDRGTLRALPRP